jgi:hypothetical protein
LFQVVTDIPAAASGYLQQSGMYMVRMNARQGYFLLVGYSKA